MVDNLKYLKCLNKSEYYSSIVNVLNLDFYIVNFISNIKINKNIEKIAAANSFFSLTPLRSCSTT